MASTILTYAMIRRAGSTFTATVRFVAPTPALPTNANQDAANTPDWVTEGQDSKALEAMYSTVVASRETIEPAMARLGLPISASDLIKHIDFKATGQRLFELRITDHDPDRAEAIANALADSFVDRNHSLYTQRAAKVVAVLEEQLRGADAKLTDIRRRYDEYSGLHKLSGTPADTVRDAQYELENAVRRRDSVKEELAAAEARLADKDRELRASVPAAYDAHPVPSNAEITLLEDQLLRVDNELTGLRKKYYDDNPRVAEALANRNKLQAKLDADQRDQEQAAEQHARAATFEADRRAVEEIRREIDALRAQREALEATIARMEGQIQQSKGLDTSYSALANEVTACTEARTNLALRLNSARLALDVAERQNPIVIMERVNAVNPPVNSTAGRARNMVILVAIGSFALVCGMILWLDSMDRRVRTTREAEMALPAPIIASIPHPAGPVTYETLGRATEIAPQSLQSESYRFLGLHLLNTRDARIRSIMMLAAKAEQGSTTTLTNLGITLAQAGQRVVIVDANMRTAEIHHIFRLSNDFGFTDLLENPERQVLMRALRQTSTPNLRVITSGPIAGNVWELLRSENLRAVSSLLLDVADYVLYDTPSAMMFTDAMNLACIVDAAFLCVRAQETLTGAEERLVDMMEKTGVKVLGSVLSDVPSSAFEGYANYQEYYMPAMASNARATQAMRPGRPSDATRLLTIDELPLVLNVPGAPNGTNGGMSVVETSDLRPWTD
jgi:capsular exopolysaccharide synthesis family protein